METTFCLTITMFFINGISHAEKTSYQFEKHANLRLESTFDRSEATSAIVCCGICKITIDCLSVCYNKVTKECLMSKVSGCFVTDNSQPDDAWHVYTETGKHHYNIGVGRFRILGGGARFRILGGQGGA